MRLLRRNYKVILISASIISFFFFSSTRLFQSSNTPETQPVDVDSAEEANQRPEPEPVRYESAMEENSNNKNADTLVDNADDELIDWHDYAAIELEKQRQGPGERGVPVLSSATDNATAVKEGYEQNGFNAYISDKISLNRTMPDLRHPLCKSKKYHRNLPTASVIIPFHQEHFSTLIRTVNSLLYRAPKHLIKEIILADDFSSKAFLKAPLDEYVKKNYHNVKIVRANQREGLIRTRLMGARQATGDVLIFIDSHCETVVNWLPPLLDPISQNYKTVTCPLIDVIDEKDFKYGKQDDGARGGFDWQFFYKRLPLLPEDLQKPAEPFNSPVMAGGLFAISAKWFWELNGYDPGLDIWGGEQYELSFKIWQCGGRMVDAPCSRIAHIYRKFAPFPNPGLGDFVHKNYKRVAEVWMDEYKEYLYMRNPEVYNRTDPGDLSAQLQLRQSLQCKPFKWFMEEVAFDLARRYPLILPKPLALGEIRNVQHNACLQSLPKNEVAVNLGKCSKDGDQHNNIPQNWEYDFHLAIKLQDHELCLDFSRTFSTVLLFHCHESKGNQEWHFQPASQQLFHMGSSLCLDVKEGRMELTMSECDENLKSQKWQFEHVDMKEMKKVIVM